MSQLIIDEQSSQTPIGDLLQRGDGNVIEMRSVSGELLGTLFLSDSIDGEVPPHALKELEADAELIRERMTRPISEGLTKDEFFDRLQQLGRNP